MHEEEEITTPDGPSAFKQILEQLDRVETLVKHLADNAFTSNAAYARLEKLVESHGNRLTSVELRTTWVPLAFSTLSLCGTAWCIVWCLTRVH